MRRGSDDVDAATVDMWPAWMMQSRRALGRFAVVSGHCVALTWAVWVSC